MAAPVSKGQVSDPERVMMAEKVARDVVNADPTILGLLVLDRKHGYDALTVARSPSLPPEDYASPALVEKFAIAATVVWGASEQAAQLMGRQEFIVGAFKGQMVLLIDLKEYDMLLAMRLTRSSNAEHLYLKIADLLGIG